MDDSGNLGGLEALTIGGGDTVFIAAESDFPTAVGGYHPLNANTSYIITTQINMVDGIEFGNNTSINGAGLSAILNFPSTLTAFKSLNNNVYIKNITVNNGGDNAIGLCDFRNIDYTGAAPFWGRVNYCEIIGVNFINFYNLGIIDGFATNNLMNCVMGGSTVTQNPINGFFVSNGLSFEFNGNKVVLFKGTSVPNTGSLVTIASNTTYNPAGANIGFNAIVFNSNIIHPRDQEIGFNIEPGSTTQLGTISGNTFIRSGGSGPLINYTNEVNFDNYNPQEVINFAVDANKGVLNSVPDAKVDFNGNTQTTVITAVNTYVPINVPTNRYDAIDLNTRIGIQFTMLNTTPFVVDEIITGLTSGTQARVVDVVSPTEYYVIDTTGAFNNTELLTGSIAGSGSINTSNGMNFIFKYLDVNPRKLSLVLSCQLSQVAGTSISWEIAFLQNGILNDCTATIDVLRFNRPGTVSILCLRKIEYGDIISFQIRNLDNTTNCLIRRASVIVGPG